MQTVTESKSLAVWQGDLRVRSSIRQYSLDMDEPHAFSGTDTGASPLEVMLQALGGCLVITTSYLIRKKGLTPRKIEFEVIGESNLSGKVIGFTRIQVIPRVEIEEGEKLAEILTEVESVCPVSYALKHETPVSML